MTLSDGELKLIRSGLSDDRRRTIQVAGVAGFKFKTERERTPDSISLYELIGNRSPVDQISAEILQLVEAV